MQDSDIQHECMEYLFERGADANTQDVSGRTPLHLAAKEGCTTCIQLLLKHGAKTDVRNSDGETPLHVMLQSGLGSSAGPVQKDDDTTTAEAVRGEDSHSSVESGTPSLLFGNEQDITNVVGSFYQSPRETDAISYNKVNDSGYFTARGNAWVKNQYYNNDRIEEERESSIGSSISDIDARYEVDTKSDSSGSKDENDAHSRPLFFEFLEFVLRIILYLLHSLLAWTKQSKTLERTEATIDSRGTGLQFAAPPDHVAEAMEKLRKAKKHGD